MLHVRPLEVVAMQRMPRMRRYLIRLDHGYDGDTEQIEFEALGAEIAISRLETIPNKRRAVIFEDDQQIADLSYMEGFWRMAAVE